jgi:hypothetical protein
MRRTLFGEQPHVGNMNNQNESKPPNSNRARVLNDPPSGNGGLRIWREALQPGEVLPRFLEDGVRQFGIIDQA